MAFTLEQLETMGCACCEKEGRPAVTEQPRFFHGRCHPGAGCSAAVEHDKLTITCQCGKLIAEIWVDSGNTKRSEVTCPHDTHSPQFTALYFENDVMIMCPPCDKLAALFRVLTNAEAKQRQTTN